MGFLRSLFGGLFQESHIKVKANLTPTEEELRRSILIEYIRLNKATNRLRNLGNDCTMLYKNGYVDKEFFNKVMMETMRTAQKIVPKIGTLKTKLIQLGVPPNMLDLIAKGFFTKISKNLEKLGISMEIVNRL